MTAAGTGIGGLSRVTGDVGHIIIIIIIIIIVVVVIIIIIYYYYYYRAE